MTLPGFAGGECLPLPRSKGGVFPFLLILGGCPTASANVAQGQRCSLGIQETPGPSQGLLNLEGVRRTDARLLSVYAAFRKSGGAEKNSGYNWSAKLTYGWPNDTSQKP